MAAIKAIPKLQEHTKDSKTLNLLRQVLAVKAINMKLSAFIELIPNLKEDERERLRPFINSLTTSGQAELDLFQRNWFLNPEHGRKDYDKYVESQNKEILRVVNMELSEIGAMARKIEKLPELTLDTEVNY